MLRGGRGDVAGAIVALRRATVLAPGLVAAQRELAALAKRQQDWPTAAAALTAVVAWEPTDARAREELHEADAHRSSHSSASDPR